MCVVFGFWQLRSAQQVFQSREATILLGLTAKSSNISRTVSATTKFVPTVPARGIVELENVQETASYIVNTKRIGFDVKKDYRCSSLDHCVV